MFMALSDQGACLVYRPWQATGRLKDGRRDREFHGVPSALRHASFLTLMGMHQNLVPMCYRPKLDIVVPPYIDAAKINHAASACGSRQRNILAFFRGKFHERLSTRWIFLSS